MVKCSLLLAVLAGVAFAAASAQAKTVSKPVDYADQSTALQGYLAWDDEVQGKRPGVLVVQEWWGLNDFPKSVADRLAALGYVALAVDMYGKGVLAGSVQEAAKLAAPFKADRNLMRRRAMAGLEVLKSQPQVDASRLVAIGFCFGGTTVLELARAGAPLAGVVSFHGDLTAPMPAQGAITSSVLVLHGAEDTYVPPGDVAGLMDELRKAGTDWQIVWFSGAVHSFTNPASGNDPSKGVAYNDKAARRSWRYMQDFLEEKLSR
jgi:dienelactone hydrolase